jgi:transcriptional regulator
MRLVDAYPLCWVLSGGAADRLATALPLLAERNPDGRVDSLLGHIPIRNPQRAALEQDPRATILCMGPQGYISPELVSNPTWGPTWNYAACRFEVDVEFVPDETDFSLSRLAAALEGGAPRAWTPQRMGPRYDQLKQHIVGFRAHVRETHPRFKLGQDESDETFAEIVDGLAGTELADWMRRARS